MRGTVPTNPRQLVMTMSVEVDFVLPRQIDEQEENVLRSLADRAISIVLDIEGRSKEMYEVSVLYTDDSFIRELNDQYRGEDSATDVLSFPMMCPEEMDISSGFPEVLGDIVISLDTAERQAKERGVALQDEVGLLLIHGCLHLLGYDHDDANEEAIMWRKQETALNLLRKTVKGQR